jgi:hypothetical protein
MTELDIEVRTAGISRIDRFAANRVQHVQHAKGIARNILGKKISQSCLFRSGRRITDPIADFFQAGMGCVIGTQAATIISVNPSLSSRGQNHAQTDAREQQKREQGHQQGHSPFVSLHHSGHDLCHLVIQP